VRLSFGDLRRPLELPGSEPRQHYIRCVSVARTMAPRCSALATCRLPIAPARRTELHAIYHYVKCVRCGGWLACAAGLELQCGHANAAFAMARGGSRRHGKVWTVQPSGWGYGPTTEGCGPLRCTPKGGATAVRACTASEMKAGATCQGAEASHSYSWYWRIWHHAWFAGAPAFI
jgi:hypothetical protein